MFRVTLSACAAAVALGCATSNKEKFVETKVISFPDGALVEYNGKKMGRAPARITLPQDEEGRLTERAEIRVLPNSNQPELFPQSRIFEPSARDTRVPDRVMVDMTRGTNEVRVAQTPAVQIEGEKSKASRPRVPYTERSKPTQAVGLDRWKPGIY